MLFFLSESQYRGKRVTWRICLSFVLVLSRDNFGIRPHRNYFQWRLMSSRASNEVLLNVETKTVSESEGQKF